MQVYTGSNGLKGYGAVLNTTTNPNAIGAGSMAFTSKQLPGGNAKTIVGRFLASNFIFAGNNWTENGGIYNDFKTNNTGKLHGSVNKAISLVSNLRFVNYGTNEAKLNLYLLRAFDGGDQTLVGINDVSLVTKASSASDRHRLIERDYVVRGAGSPLAVLELRNLMLGPGDMLVADTNGTTLVSHWEAYDPSGFRENMVVSGFGDSFVTNRQVGVVW